MDANKREFEGLHGDEVYQIVGCAFEVLNELGSGLVEKPYENSLTVEIAQMLNYLKITGLKVGLIINFKRPKLEWERIVLEKHS